MVVVVSGHWGRGGCTRDDGQARRETIYCPTEQSCDALIVHGFAGNYMAAALGSWPPRDDHPQPRQAAGSVGVLIEIEQESDKSASGERRAAPLISPTPLSPTPPGVSNGPNACRCL
ncbi:uncharacterized protein ATNIH1004_003825 [Aspergillus tanneri]|uniref:Uncharacterized protein n=1 Tax=Aspergillus tanneri TaxID=1220188 RepID=A0A5M9MSU0_9EURO|nr:uncharacterized protein ATNIH1004_003825 [Aspergillus tanneri]KAA8647943.1 hypothetical protein ATNIH1004_003825 [Aspergillus tanneri]